MIASFRSKALERSWWKEKHKAVRTDHIARLILLHSSLDVATKPTDMANAGFGLHPLTGDQKDRYAVKVNKNQRLTFGWSNDGPDAVAVDYEDYH